MKLRVLAAAIAIGGLLLWYAGLLAAFPALGLGVAGLYIFLAAVSKASAVSSRRDGSPGPLGLGARNGGGDMGFGGGDSGGGDCG